MNEQKLEEANLLSWNSIIDNRFSVFIIYPNHPTFKQLEGIYFKIFGVAFLDFETMTVFIDGKEFSKDGYTIDHLYAIEAHEIAHYILQHDRKRPTKDQEREADAAGIVILEYLNHHKAKDLLITRFKGLYTSDYDINNNLPSEELKKLKDYLKSKNPSLLDKLIDKIKKIFRIDKK
jgi:hypothetical protein